MNMPLEARFGLLAALAPILLLAPTRADEGAPLPRYALEPGREFRFHGKSEFKYLDRSLGTETDWQVWVVRKNDDGSSRVVLRSGETSSYSAGGRKQGAGPARVAMGSCDLFPDGRIARAASLGDQLDPTSIFPRLPEEAEQAEAGWGGVWDDARIEYRPAPGASADPGSWAFEGVRHSAMDEIYLTSSRSRFVFDRKRGAIRRAENERTQRYGIDGKGTGTTELVSVEDHDAAWTRTFAEEACRYFAASESYAQLLAKAAKDTRRVDALLSEAESTLRHARETLVLPVLREQVGRQLEGHKRMASSSAGEAKNRAEVVGRPAADWETKDLEGKPHALKDYRGKVVILDFWERGCGWCIRAMPQLVQLSGDFRGQPVAVLGMNSDQKEEDARFVVDVMKLNYPTLKAAGLGEKYHVRGLPTLIVVDRDGKIADVHVGYSPKLREELSKTVKALLAGE